MSKPVITDRELEVLLLLSRGYIEKQVGDSLKISTRTVQSHKQNALRKLGLDRTIQVPAELLRRGYCELGALIR